MWEKTRDVELKEGNLLGPEGGTSFWPTTPTARYGICDGTIVFNQVAPVMEGVSDNLEQEFQQHGVSEGDQETSKRLEPISSA